MVAAKYGSPSKEQLLRFRAAMDVSADAIYLVDRRTMRLVDVNETACTRTGYAREELLKLGPQDLLNTSREELEQQYDAVIAAGATGIKTESSARAKDGRKSVTELHRRALRLGDRWIIVSIARDVTERKRAKRAALRIGRMYAVLSATNEAILRSTQPAELYQRVCDAAVQGGPFIVLAAVYTPDPDTSWMTVAAMAGAGQERIHETRFSVAEARAEGRGLIGTAFRTRKPCISNDILNDERLRNWWEYARDMRHLAAVAVPLLQGGSAVGVLHFCANEVNVFDDESVALFERMGENVSFALENFARKSEHERAEAGMRAAEEQFRGLVEQSIAGIYIIQDRKFAYVNQRYAEIFGYATADELVGNDPFMVVSEKDRDAVKQTIHGQMERGAGTVSYSFTGLRKDGSTIEAGAHGARASHRGRPAMIGLMQDISEKKRAEDEIRQYVAKLESAFMRTVEVTMSLSDLRDPYTAGHERRVAEISVAIGAELGFDAHRQEGLRVAGYLHDVGKMAIPAEILAKPGKLSAVEFALVKGHAQVSYDILKNVEFPWPVAQVALQHHERLDGSGYPQGLKGDAILLEARILAVADVVEAMATHRPYRPGLGIEKALAEIERGRGSAYDPVVADTCLKLFRDKGYSIPD
ncbi:MAG: HD domain-containing phosphohydrolase [Burkholderiales bacterium]